MSRPWSRAATTYWPFVILGIVAGMGFSLPRVPLFSAAINHHVASTERAAVLSFSSMVRTLANAFAAGRIAHAFMLTGVRGVGKTRTARIIAKALNCEAGISATPCGVCSACTQIDADRFMDYIELDAASNRSIDEIRDLIERAVRYRRMFGGALLLTHSHAALNLKAEYLVEVTHAPLGVIAMLVGEQDPQQPLLGVLPVVPGEGFEPAHGERRGLAGHHHAVARLDVH